VSLLANLSVSDRWAYLRHAFPHGSHWQHSTDGLLRAIVCELRDALLDLNSPVRIAISGSRGRNRTITIANGDRTKRIPVVIHDRAVVLEEEIISVARSEGPMALVRALARRIEVFLESVS
jgi:hypothetical protein